MILEIHYNRNRDVLTKKLAGRVGTRYNAEDVVQEAYARALKYFRAWTYDGVGTELDSFNRWFTTILNNACREFQYEERGQGMVRAALVDGDVMLYGVKAGYGVKGARIGSAEGEAKVFRDDMLAFWERVLGDR